MKLSRKRKNYSWLVCFALILSLLTPFSAHAANDIYNATPLKSGQSISSAIAAGQPVWFKLDPSSDVGKNSHITVTAEGDSDPYITVYPDINSAIANSTYSEYNQQYNSVNFPIAWKGPYYIKIEADYDGTFTVGGQPTYKEPEEIGGACMIEASVENDTSTSGLLATMRSVRDSLLEKTSLGKELNAFYYNVSKAMVMDVLADKSFRNEISSSLKELKPLISEMDKISQGHASSYKVTDKDFDTMVNLKNNVLEKAPKNLAQSINQYWNVLNLNNIKGKSLDSFLMENKLISDSKDYLPNEIIVSLKGDNTTASALATAKAVLGNQVQVSALKTEDTTIDNTYIVKFQGDASQKAMAAALEKLPNVNYAEPNYKATSFGNDIQYTTQWSLENKGQFEGTPGIDIGYTKLNPLLAGMKLNQTLIGVVDTGVNHTFQDLNSLVRVDLGKDFVNSDLDSMDDNDHGTHVSATIAASSDNYYSVAGINQHASIIPVKVLDEDGRGDMSDVALGIRHAVDNGAKVINLSLGSSSFVQTVEDQLIYAKQKGVTVIAAAGNDGSSTLSYPGRSENVISVGATDNTDALADFSNYGDGIDIVAPGVKIASLTKNGEVKYASGTSMATPHVVAVAGLIYAMKPDVKPDQVMSLLTNNTVELGTPGYDTTFGWGRLDAAKVVTAVKKLLVKPGKPTVNPVDDNDTMVTGTAEKNVTVTVKNGNTSLGSATSDTYGKYSVSIKPQKAGSTLSITATKDGITSDPAKTTVLDKTAPSAPSVNEVKDYDKKVAGKTEAAAKVTVKAGSTILGYATADKYGIYSVTLKSAQKAGTTLAISAKDKAGNTSKTTYVTVKDKTAPAAPSVNEVKDYDKKVTGKAEAAAKVTVKAGSTILGYATADKYGNYSVTLKSAQKAGTTLAISAKDKAGNTSKTTYVTVKDKTAPTAPKVNTVRASSTSVTGTAEANSKVYVKNGKSIIGSTTAKSNGSFTVKIPKQKAESILYVYAKDIAGNTGKSTKITVAR
ncbi:Ig-like domain-containing protein [Neobacillus sp. 179-C4.2 HS]|uniref:Ig-like domain-containing protein n=1 Tax=Neobacillus driksii TaxID=3035913 RepID=A0ABV4YYX5_9BACI|nr:Ig-like domain-containing protein [Neobacillus sp. 179.-C4.2 HS]MDP5194640.1 Ig-like domain-containing protein [Neobacillus sp. 179.-C4.2 HS]